LIQNVEEKNPSSHTTNNNKTKRKKKKKRKEKMMWKKTSGRIESSNENEEKIAGTNVGLIYCLEFVFFLLFCFVFFLLFG
jgi:hypothetical protein